MARRCPSCQLFNPDDAARCDCGFDFARHGSSAPAGGRLSVSKSCPTCGQAQYRRVRPHAWVAFTRDRICLTCGTRYAPPTPLWAGALLILAGMALAALGALSVLAHLANGDPGAVLAFFVESLTCLLGLIVVAHGVRSLSRGLVRS